MERLIYSKQLGDLANIVIIDGEIVKNKYVCELTQKDILKQIINNNNILIQEGDELYIYCNTLTHRRVENALEKRINNNIHVRYKPYLKGCLPEAMVNKEKKLDDKELEMIKITIMICEKSGISYREGVNLVNELIKLGHSINTIKFLAEKCGVDDIYTIIKIYKRNKLTAMIIKNGGGI